MCRQIQGGALCAGELLFPKSFPRRLHEVSRGRHFLRLLIFVCFAGLLDGPTQSRADDPAITLARLKTGENSSTRLGALPDQLSRRDVERYRQIMELQTEGDWQAADRLIDQIRNPLLMGHVMAQRYLHPTGYLSSYDELSEWLGDYADHPQAERVYRLAVIRWPGNVAMPNEPVEGYLNGSGQELLQERAPRYRSPVERTEEESRAVDDLRLRVLDLVARDEPDLALDELENAPDGKFADEAELDLSRWWVARSYYANQRFRKSYAIAKRAASRSGVHEPRLHWTAGLAAWRLGRFDAALRHFDDLAGSDIAEGEDVATGAFWAARAAVRAGRPELADDYLDRAADASDQFYGLLAKASLGRPITFEWHETALRHDVLDLLLQFPGSRRAIGLHQLGHDELAAAEIRKLAARSKPELVKALTALAEALDLPAAQMRVAQRLRLQDGRRHDGAMFPIPEWRPETGFTIDRALTYAIARAESGFDPDARSVRGAYGLMQILPATAKRMSDKAEIEFQDHEELLLPERNLELGQIYIGHLLDTDTVDHSLIHLCLAYNGGLGRLGRWKQALEDVADDPLLFLESIPVSESRLYTKKVLANLWAYRTRFNQPLPSLEALSANRWPSYYAYDRRETLLAGPY